MKQLRVPPDTVKLSSIFVIGLSIGLALPLALVAALWISITPASALEQSSSVLIVFRMLGLIVLLVWMWGLDVLVWKHYKAVLFNDCLRLIMDSF